jgi:hypothetical protein
MPSPRPALLLPRVQVAPTATIEPAGPPARPSALRVALAFTLMVGPQLVGLIALVALVATSARALADGDAVTWWLVLTAAVALLVGWMLFTSVRTAPNRSTEIVIAASDEPELHIAVAATATAVGARHPDRIVVAPGTSIEVVDSGPLLGQVRTTRTVRLGTEVIDALSVDELRGLLAFGFAQLERHDIRSGPRIVRSRAARDRVLLSLKPSSQSLYRRWSTLQLRVEAPIHDYQAAMARGAAARTVGRQPLMDALRSTSLVVELSRRYFWELVYPVVRAGALPPWASGFRQYLAEPGRVTMLLEELAPGWPPRELIRLLVRIQRLDAPQVVAPVDPRSASVWFRQPQRWQESIHRSVMEAATKGPLPAISWADTPTLLLVPVVRREAETVDRSLLSIGMPRGTPGLAAALGTERVALATALIAHGWGAEGEPVEAMLRRAGRAALQRDVLDAGGSVRFSWSGERDTVDRNGAPVDLERHVDDLLEEPADRPGPPLTVPTGEVQVPPPSAPSPGSSPPDPTHQAPTLAPDAANVLHRHVLQLGDTIADLPAPMMPPFRRVPGGYQVTMHGTAFGRTPFTVTTDSVHIDGTRLPFDQVEHVRLRRDSDCLVVRLVVDGRTAKVVDTTRTESDRFRSGQTFDLLLPLLQSRVGPRLVDAALATLRRDGAVVLGSLRMTADGVIGRNGSTLDWHLVGEPVLHGRNRYELPVDGAVVRVDLADDDVLVLPMLLAALRRGTA